VVPSVHPGPFKNIGSSLLPSLLKKALEEKSGRVACVPLGLLGHELDLASQKQNKKIIDGVVESTSFVASEDKATPLVMASDGIATACCQVFGNTAFLSFTLAPKTTEDLPQELGLFVQQEAEKHGLDCCVVVNAHNSIDETANMKDVISSLEKVAANCLEKAASLNRLPFEIGAATVFPKEFGLHDGMGPGGISAIVVRVQDQKTVYVVIDGNNMVSGLREKVLSALQSMGFDKGEVFTTDTHAVSALILGGRGYHPVGEAIDHEKLIGYIKEAVRAADANLERCRCGCRRVTVSDVKAIGETLLGSLSLLIDKAAKKAKRVTVPLFGVSGFLLLAILLVL
jgi:putative membrane protein